MTAARSKKTASKKAKSSPTVIMEDTLTRIIELKLKKISWDVVETFEAFFSQAHPSDFTEHNNLLLDAYMERLMEEKDNPVDMHLGSLVHLAGQQNHFITKLYEIYREYQEIKKRKADLEIFTEV